MPITLPTRHEAARLVARNDRIAAECRPGRSDEEVAAAVGCKRTTVAAVRRMRNIPAGCPNGRPPLRAGESTLAAAPCPLQWAALARSLGLAVVVWRTDYCGSEPHEFWVVSGPVAPDQPRGKRVVREMGSWVPATGSCRVLTELHKGVTDPAAALNLFGEATR